MIFRLSFVLILTLSLLVYTLHALNPAQIRQRHEEDLVGLMDNNSNEVDNERPAIVIRGHNEEDTNDDENHDDLLEKRHRYPNFRVSPLWLSRRTRTNRIYGKPLWISRPGR